MPFNPCPQRKTRIPGPNSKRWMRELEKYECPQITYSDKDSPIFWEKGSGSNIEDVDGNTYIDLTAAFGVANCGHSNPRIIKAANKQLQKLSHGMGDVHPTDLKVKLAKKLAEITPGNLQQVIFSSSGSEAVESALKTAMMVTRKPGVIAFEGAYHGLTYGTLGLTARHDFKEPFLKQLAKHTVHLPYPNHYKDSLSDKELLNRLWDNLENTTRRQLKSKYPIGAVIAEPIQGRGGVIIPPDGFLVVLEAFCREWNLILILDEVYTGFGRTGKMFASEYENIVPDLLCLGKGMANGFPISACIGKRSIMQKWRKSKGEAIHTSTFLGNPLGCAMALSAIEEIEKKKLCERSYQLGQYFLERLLSLQNQFDIIGNVRGKGLMIGIELVKDKKSKKLNSKTAVQIIKSALKQGIILLTSGECGNILCITPPLTVKKEQIDYSIAVLENCFKKLKY